MKSMICCLLVAGVISGSLARSQTFDEWFRQKSTRIKYLQEQVAALAGLLKTLDKGYQLVENGLQGIGGFTQDEYMLHTNYYGSLVTVLPVIAGGPEAAIIRDIGASLINQIGAALQYWQEQRNSIKP